MFSPYHHATAEQSNTRQESTSDRIACYVLRTLFAVGTVAYVAAMLLCSAIAVAVVLFS